MNNDWINKLREEEQHFEMQAPEGLWENIQRDLTKDIDSADNSNAEKSASAKGNLWLKRILIAAAACALALVCFKLTMNNTDALKETEIAKAEKTIDARIKEIGDQTETVEEQSVTAQIADTETFVAKAETNRVKTVTPELPEKAMGVANEPSHVNAIVTDGNKETVQTNNSGETVATNSEYASPSTPESTSKPPQKSDRQTDGQTKISTQSVSLPRKSSLGGVSLSTQTAFAMGNNPSSSYVVYNFNYRAAPAVSRPDAAPTIIKHDKVPVGFSYKDKHKMLFSLGLLLNVPVSERLSIDCGVALTKTEKERNILNGSLTHVVKTDYDYIGVPVALKYDVIKTKNLSVYGKAGGKIDFNYAADETAETWEKGQTESSKMSYDIDQTKNPQFSLSAAVGAQWLLAKHLALYLEPGYVYYINNGSSDVYFNEKPHNFNINLGVRVPIINH